ncbi:MAG TPA: kelch repeat-containing protein [Xanthobacteraceae bacterium]|nr:kelch repeat-containing protein [Xanthobacteraceae bacterium]
MPRTTRVIRGLLGAAAFAAVAALSHQAMAQAPARAPTAANPWTTLAPFPQGAEEVLGAAANGKLYVFCGLGPGWKPLAMVYEYDPAADKWTQKKPMALPSHHVAFAVLNDKIYAFGGFTLPDSGPPAWVPINNAWEYDPANDAWKALAPMPTKRGAAGAAVANGKIYVVGGATTLPGTNETSIHPQRPMNVVATVEEYDPATNTWRERRSMLVARNHHATASVDGKIYAIGGRIGSAFISNGSNNIDLTEMYDPAADTWVVRDKMPTRRSAIGGVVYNGKIIVPGGEFQDRRELAAFRAVEIYDPAVNRWQVLPSMPHPRHGLAIGVIGDRLYAVSGDGQSAGNGIQHSAVNFNEALQLDLVAK